MNRHALGTRDQPRRSYRFAPPGRGVGGGTRRAPLNRVRLSRVPLRRVPLSRVPLSRVPLSRVRLSRIPHGRMWRVGADHRHSGDTSST
jgi:hypothetical protein